MYNLLRNGWEKATHGPSYQIPKPVIQDKKISIIYFDLTIQDRVPLVLIQSFPQSILMACGSKGQMMILVCNHLYLYTSHKQNFASPFPLELTCLLPFHLVHKIWWKNTNFLMLTFEILLLMSPTVPFWSYKTGKTKEHFFCTCCQLVSLEKSFHSCLVSVINETYNDIRHTYHCYKQGEEIT